MKTYWQEVVNFINKKKLKTFGKLETVESLLL